MRGEVATIRPGRFARYAAIDGVRQDRVSGNVDWHQKSYAVTGAGPHTFRWQYAKDDVDDGYSYDCGWVDYVQWTGSTSPTDWEMILYTYDPSGRRIRKTVGDQTTKYLYDGGHCIAEYDGDDTLLRKFIYGPCIDEPICMIDVADSHAVYYYHYDALGSVVALSDSAGDTVQLYEYDVFGQVAAADPNHPNPFLFTGRRYDTETGLYYYRARYYNPTIGRFLQTDPIGYADGMNMYAYCGNNSLNCVDPLGLASWRSIITRGLRTFGGGCSVIAGIGMMGVPGLAPLAVGAMAFGFNALVSNAYALGNELAGVEPSNQDVIRYTVSHTVEWATNGKAHYVALSLKTVDIFEIVTAAATITLTLKQTIEVGMSATENLSSKVVKYWIWNSAHSARVVEVTYKTLSGTERVIRASAVAYMAFGDVVNTPWWYPEGYDPENPLPYSEDFQGLKDHGTIISNEEWIKQPED